jgi:hypothetical protein
VCSSDLQVHALCHEENHLEGHQVHALCHEENHLEGHQVHALCHGENHLQSSYTATVFPFS